MAKAQAKKKSSLTKWLIIGGVVVIGYLVLTPQDDTKVAVTSKPAAKKKLPTDQAFLPVDFSHQASPYPPLKLALVDAFHPDIVHGSGTESADSAGPGWTYSGMAVFDGVGQGVLVNTTTGESAIVHRGEKWQTFKIADITPDHLVFNGPNGPQTLRVDTKEAEKPSPSTATASTGFGPLPPMSGPLQMPLTGDIGAGGQSLSIVGDSSGFGGRRGGRGRGRGRNAGN